MQSKQSTGEKSKGGVQSNLNKIMLLGQDQWHKIPSPACKISLPVSTG